LHVFLSSDTIRSQAADFRLSSRLAQVLLKIERSATASRSRLRGYIASISEWSLSKIDHSGTGAAAAGTLLPNCHITVGGGRRTNFYWRVIASDLPDDVAASTARGAGGVMIIPSGAQGSTSHFEDV
jgi:hypothetical protein